MENNNTMRTNDFEETMQTEVATKVTQVVPINCEAAMRSFSKAEKKEILALADQIDVTRLENVMNYGSLPLRKTFEQCGSFLEDERGSLADQEVINRVVELAKKASDSYDDFNIVLREPNFFQRLLLKMSTGAKSHREKIQHSAITNYKLLVELKQSCDSWIDTLRSAMGEIEKSMLNDGETIGLLEKYIIAGKIAEKRIEGELDGLKNKYTETGLQKYDQDYSKIKEGYEIFSITMNNLEKSRVMYYLSMAQLKLIGRSNRNVQISIRTQVNNSIALLGQQMRNAILDAKTHEVLEGQKAINRLNDAVVKDVSKSIGLTAQETEELLYAGFYDVEMAKQAVECVINSCNAIKDMAEEMLPKMKADVTELNTLIKELEPCIGVTENTLNEERPKQYSNETAKLNF